MLYFRLSLNESVPHMNQPNQNVCPEERSKWVSIYSNGSLSGAQKFSLCCLRVSCSAHTPPALSLLLSWYLSQTHVEIILLLSLYIDHVKFGGDEVFKSTIGKAVLERWSWVAVESSPKVLGRRCQNSWRISVWNAMRKLRVNNVILALWLKFFFMCSSGQKLLPKCISIWQSHWVGSVYAIVDYCPSFVSHYIDFLMERKSS